MTLQTSGPLSMAQIAAELNISPNGLSLGDSRILALAGLSSSPISMSQLYGKSSASAAPTYGPVSVSAANGSNSTSNSSTVAIYVGSNATASGGDGAYSYSWSYVNGDTGFVINASTISNPTWYRNTDPSTSWSANWRCTVTDGHGNTGSTTISINVQNTYTAPAYSPVAVSAPNAYVVQSTGTGRRSFTVSSNATASGGSGGYTYSWSYVSGATAFAISNANAQQGVWTVSAIPGQDVVALWQVIAYDSRGVAASTQISIEVDYQSNV